MADISPSQVKNLRERTGAGMMDCKKALAEAGGDMEAAIDWLRKKGLSAAAKKSGRVAAEGLIGVAASPRRAAMVEVNAETDFVARNESFQNFVETVAKVALEVGADVDAIRAAPYPGTGRSVADELTQMVATIGENMNLRRAVRLEVPEGVVATYVHGAVKQGVLGKIGVVVAVRAASELEALETLGRQVGMHVAATKPEFLDVDSVDPAALDRERAVLAEQARGSGKPEAVIEKMIEGRIRKYYEEVVLLEQVWVHDGESRVRAVAKKAGVELAGFVRYQLGEGIERAGGDFATEVAAAAGLPPRAPAGGAAAEPATAQPATAQPATAQPATAQPATAQPATAQSASVEPVSVEPEPAA